MSKQKIKEIDFLKKKKQLGIISIQSTRNNTILTLTDLKGNTKSWTSSGSVGFKNSRKSTPYAAQAATEKLVINAINLGFSSVIIKMKGLGRGKQHAVRAISKSELKITKIEERSPISHNGCRPSKKRRI